MLSLHQFEPKKTSIKIIYISEKVYEVFLGFCINGYQEVECSGKPSDVLSTVPSDNGGQSLLLHSIAQGGARLTAWT